MTFKLLPLKITIAFLVSCCSTYAQQKVVAAKGLPTDTTKHSIEHIIKQVDIYDIFKKITGKKEHLKVSDSITSKPIFSFVPAVGYTLSSGFAGSVSGNIQFRTDSTARISTITASGAASSKQQITFPVVSTIWLKHNKYALLGDYRFYDYPQSTFGLGSSAHIQNENPMKFDYVRFYETLLRQVTGNFYLGAGYNLDYHYNITEQGNRNGKTSDYIFYGRQTHTSSSGYTINALYDGRDNAVNPGHGFYTFIQFRDNYKKLGSTSDWNSLIIDIRKYINFPSGSGNTLALWSYDWLSLRGRAPYLDLPATSWDAFSSTGRGYIQGRYRGAQMVYGEVEYRFRITGNGLIGGVLFLNGESFSAQQGTRLQSIQPGFGPGLRIKLNKVSKTNVCIDYGFGHEGSRGLFINVGELF